MFHITANVNNVSQYRTSRCNNTKLKPFCANLVPCLLSMNEAQVASSPVWNQAWSAACDHSTQEVEAGRPEYPEHPWINWPPPPFFFDKGSCVSRAGPKLNYIVKDDLELLILILLLQTSGVTSIHHHASTMGWENQEFRVILCYTRISSPAWATHRPCLKTNKTVNFMLPKFLPGL